MVEGDYGREIDRDNRIQRLRGDVKTLAYARTSDWKTSYTKSKNSRLDKEHVTRK